MILENKHHIWLAAAALTAGILLAGKMPQRQIIPAILILLGIAAVLAFDTVSKKEKTCMALILTGLILFGFGLAHHQAMQYDKKISLVEQQQTEKVRISGILVQKENKSGKYLYQLRKTYLNTDHKPAYLGNILLYTEDDTIPIGSIVVAEGDLELFPAARNDGNFDFSVYYRQMNLTCRCFAEQVQCVKKPHLSVGEFLYRIQKKIMDTYRTELNERDAGILSTLVAGSKSLLDAETKTAYQQAGISHILAVSGLHISVFGFSIYRFLHRCRRSYPCSAAVSSLCVISFAMMSGFGVSAKRAVVMYLCMMGAQVLGRKYEASHGLALAVCLILIQNPFALYQSGFLFSCTALLAILLYATLGTEENQKHQTSEENSRDSVRKIRKRGSECLERLKMNLFLQLWLIPLTAWFYYEVPVYALFLNLLVIPLCGWLLGFGAVGALVGFKFPIASKWILILCHLILNLYETGIDLTERLPFHLWKTGRLYMPLLVCYYTLFGCYFVWRYVVKQPDFCMLQKDDTGRKKISDGRKISLCARCISDIRSRIPVIICIAGFLLCMLVVPPDRPGIYFLDVGQGDGIFISDGKQKHLFVDGGSTSEKAVGTYRMLPFLKYHRIRKIDAWIVTHTDADHISGLQELLETGYPVEKLLLATAMPKDEAYEQLLHLAKENGTEVLSVQKGTKCRLDDATMECLYPDVTEQENEKNALSQVWRYHSGQLSVLLTGDLGEEQEKLLLERHLLQPVTVLKVAHHGSAYSSCMEFLAKVQPEEAIISCAEKNRYGHPSAETIERLKEADCSVGYTMKTGQISFVKEYGHWKKHCFLKET